MLTHPRIPRAVLLAGLILCGLLAHSARGSGFSDFAADEDDCRGVGTAAIQGGSGPTAAQRYDYAYRRCMAVHGRMRRIGAAQADPQAGGPAGNPHSFEYPDAFYSIPYATPGYGYDGFSY